MARLRKPSPAEPPVFIPPTTTTKSTRSSPHKTVRESPSTRELRYTSSHDPEDSFLIPKASSGTSPIRKQRVLRPVASNSRLLRKISDESLAATPDRKERRGRGRETSGQGNYLYSKTLAKTLARKQSGLRKIEVDVGLEVGSVLEQGIAVDEDDVEDLEKSVFCGDEEGVKEGDKEDMGEVEEEDDDEEDEPVVVRQRRHQPQTRRVVSDTEEDESEEEESVRIPQRKASIPHAAPKPAMKMPPLLTSMNSLHRKGHSTILNWTQEVIDLTSSPEPPASFVLPPPVRAHTASFGASSRPASSASNDVDAMLHFSPTPIKFRSPRKAPPISRPSTPPAPISPSKLVSPSKKHPRIPHASDLRPSIDAFWNPEVVNDWNDKHSPSKPLLSPRKQKLFKQLENQMNAITLSDSDDTPFPSPTTSPRKKKAQRSPTKKGPTSSSSPTVADVRAQRKDFAARKHALASAFLTELDTTVTQGRITALSASTGGIKLLWSKTLKTTAGRANWRREAIRLRTGPSPADVQTTYRHHCSIELAEKVIDDEERLYNVLAHEYCHLTTFMISEIRNNPHGAEFKAWGAKVSRAFADKSVHVTTKHSYKIEYKFVWECVLCGYEFKRHSRSVDPQRHSCGRCKGRLVQTKPSPRTGAGVGGEGKVRSEYQVFVKANFARVKEEMAARGEDIQMGRVMEVVAREYREEKEKRGKEVEREVDEVEIALGGLKL